MEQKLPERRRDSEQFAGDVEKKVKSPSSQQMKPPVERKSPNLPDSKRKIPRINRNQKIKVISHSKLIV